MRAVWYDRIDCLYYEYHSDEDRVALDRLLCDRFYVFHTHAPAVHRGTVGLIAKRLAAEFPAMDDFRIAALDD